MKKTLLRLTWLLIPATLWAQEPDIVSMSGGQLTFTDLNTNLEYQVEWAPRMSGNAGFRSGFDGIAHIQPTNVLNMSVEVPQFFRLKGRPALSNNVVRASDLQLIIHAATNSRYSLEWSESPNGPWATDWVPAYELNATGSVITVPSPRYYRITYLND